jgi:hypothetical protein
MEYPTWRKKPPTQQFLQFKKTCRLDPTSIDDGESYRTVRIEFRLGEASVPFKVMTQTLLIALRTSIFELVALWACFGGLEDDIEAFV